MGATCAARTALGQHAVDDPLLACNAGVPRTMRPQRTQSSPRCYRSSRLISTVSTTEVTTENSTMSRQPSPPPSGRISRFPKRMPDGLPPTRSANSLRRLRPLDRAPDAISGGLPDVGASSAPALLDHPFDHPDDPTGPVWIRPDRRPIQPEQARSVWSRPDRRRAPGYRSGGCAPTCRSCHPVGLADVARPTGGPPRRTDGRRAGPFKN